MIATRIGLGRGPCERRRGSAGKSGAAARARTAALAAALAPQVAPAEPAVVPLEASYAAPPGAEVRVAVAIDGDTGLPGLQPVADGLFSGGVRIEFDPALVTVTAVAPAAELDHQGFDAGARVEIGSGSAQFAGNIDLVPAVAYGGTELVTFTVRLSPSLTAPVELALTSAARAPSETVFVDGNGTDLDPDVVFGTVVVEPAVPLDIARSGTAADPSVTLTFTPIAGADHRIDFIGTLGGDAIWQPLPGAPHNTGSVTDPVVADQRFYRLVLSFP